MEVLLAALATFFLGQKLIPADAPPPPKRSKKLQFAKGMLELSAADPDLGEGDREKLISAAKQLD